nr:protein FANTASTIC FOUR 1-like [Penaeus vannamei]
MSKRGFAQQHYGSLSSDDSEEESYAGFGTKKKRLESTDNEERGEEEEEEEEDDDDDSESDENDWNNTNAAKSQTSAISNAPSNSNYSAFAQRIMVRQSKFAFHDCCFLHVCVYMNSY